MASQLPIHNMMTKPTISIIGNGRVGKALALSFENSGYSIAHRYGKGDDITDLTEIVFITTPDSEISKVVSTLISTIDHFDQTLIVHCSGTIPSSALIELKKIGADIACFHPLQAITSKTDSFDGIYFDIEGDEKSISILEKMADDLGAKSIKIDPKGKELLHLSAVIASNYLVTLTDIALQVSGSTNIPQRTLIDALLPLMNSSLQNLKELNPPDALTGPIARGDVQTVQKHITLLEKEEELLNVYKKLGLLTLELIGNDLSDNTIKFRLYDVLK